MVVGTWARSLIDVLCGIKLDVDISVLIDAFISVTVAVGSDKRASIIGGLDTDTFAIRASLRCRAPSCGVFAASEDACALQACKPSYQVWSSLTLPEVPQLLNQEPP